MKLKLDKPTVRKLALWAILIAIAPFAIEAVLLADVVGIELAFFFLLYMARSHYSVFREAAWELQKSISNALDDLSALVMFQPRNYLVHATASYIFVVVVGSTFAACVLWLPVLAMSTGAAVGFA